MNKKITAVMLVSISSLSAGAGMPDFTGQPHPLEDKCNYVTIHSTRLGLKKKLTQGSLRNTAGAVNNSLSFSKIARLSTAYYNMPNDGSRHMVLLRTSYKDTAGKEYRTEAIGKAQLHFGDESVGMPFPSKGDLRNAVIQQFGLANYYDDIRSVSIEYIPSGAPDTPDASLLPACIVTVNLCSESMYNNKSYWGQGFYAPSHHSKEIIHPSTVSRNAGLAVGASLLAVIAKKYGPTIREACSSGLTRLKTWWKSFRGKK